MSASELQRGSPYQGLIPYDEADAPFFFGREKEARLIIANLFASPLTLLYGASGVGKSSVLRAGVAHQLRAREELLVVVFNAWQSNPVTDLKSKIAEAAARVNVRINEPSDSARLTDYLAACAAQLDARLMIILDQFEEYFLYHPQEDEFASEFSRAVTQSGAPVSFLISIREDFYAKLDRFEGRIPTLYNNYLRIEHLDRKAARVAIEKPITEYNRHYTTDGQFSIEPKLVDAVLRQVETGRVIIGEAGRGVVETAGSAEEGVARIETPFLQLVMTRLWEKELGAGSHKLRLETLNELGGAGNIVRTHLDAVITRLSAREQEIAAGIFHYLVTPSGTKIAYTASDLAGSAELNEAEVVRVLERLSHGDVRILRTVEPSPDRPTSPRYEIFHDVLAPAILTWRTAYVQAQERADAERRADEQKQRADEQARVASRFRRLAMALAVVILLALGTAVFAVAQTVRAKANAARADNYARESERLRQEGQRDRALAQAERERAEGQTKLAVKLKSDADAARAATEEQIKIAKQRKAEAEKAQGVARLKTLAAAEANVAANQATLAAAEQASATRVGYSNLLAAQSKLAADRSPQRSLLLAVEALNELQPGDPSTPAAEGALQMALSQTGGRVLRGHKSQLEQVVISPNNRWLVSRDETPSVYLWDLNKSLGVPIQLTDSRLPFAFSNNGRWLATGGGPPGGTPGNNVALLWDLNEVASSPHSLSNHELAVTKIVFSADDRWLVTGSKNESMFGEPKTRVRLWDLTSADPAAKPVIIPGDANFIVETSEDGRWLATISREKNDDEGKVLHLWDLNKSDPAARSIALTHTTTITGTAISPDSRWLATASSDKTVRVWNLTATNPSATPIVLHTDLQPVDSLIFSPDGKILLASGNNDGGTDEATTLAWSLSKAAEPPLRIKVKGKLLDMVRLFEDEYVLIVQRGEEETYAYPLDEKANDGFNLRGALLGISSDHRLVVTMNVDWLSSSQGLRQLFAGSLNFDLNLRLWNFASQEALAAPLILRAHEGLTTALTFGKDSRFMVTGGADKTVRVWNITNPTMIFATPLSVNNGVEAALNADSRWLVTRGPDHTVQARDLASSDPTTGPILRGHTGKVEFAAVSSDNQLLATSSEDGTVRLWDMQAADPSATQRVLPEKASDLVFSDDKHWLAAVTNAGKSIRIWDLTAADPQLDSKGWAITEGLVVNYRIHISPDRRWLVDFRSHRLWSLAQNVNFSAENFADTEGVVISPNHEWLVFNRFSTLELWNLKDKNPAATARKVDGVRSAAAFSPDNHWLFAFKDGKPHLWDLSTSNLVPQPLVPSDELAQPKHVVFSSNGKWLAVGGAADTVLLWNLNDLKSKPLVLKGDSANLDVQAMDISPDNRWLATTSLGNVNMWDLNARNPAAVRVSLPGSGFYQELVFSRYASRLIVKDSQENLVLWILARETLVEKACRTAGRNLTEKEWSEYFPGQPYRKTCPDFSGPE